jgi:uncharacterized repeat protein (TIGR01451 family)
MTKELPAVTISMPPCFVSSFWKRVIACLVSVVLVLCLQTALLAQSPRVPHIYLQEGQSLKVNHSGDTAAVQAMQTGKAQPVSIASADVDADGVADMVVGYSAPDGGIVAVYRGNLDAFAPQSHESFLAIGRGQFPSPFLTDVQVFKVPVSPDFLVTGNFTASGHTDLVVASRGGNALYVFAGNGKGGFAAPQTISLQGVITALAAGRFGKSPATSVAVGLAGANNSFSLSVYGGTQHGLTQPSNYSLSAAASSFAFGNLTGSADIAVVSGGQVEILSGSTRQLQTVSLPVDVSAVVLGSFIHDRNSGLQMALLASDGNIHIAAHSGFDPRGYTADEARAMGLASMSGKSNSAAPVRRAPVSQGWQIVESFAAVAPFSGPAELPVMLRSRISGNSADDVMVLNPAAGHASVISHANLAAGAATFVPGGVSVSPNSGSVVAVVSMRVNAGALPGVVLLRQGQPTPIIAAPPPSHTYFVNISDANATPDPTPGAVGTICNNTSATDTSSDCSLREAVIKSNNDGGSNIIMVAAGFYSLTIGPPGGADPHDSQAGDLDILNAVSIVGDTPGTSLVSASNNDKIFSVNPTGALAGFNASISNLTLENGNNVYAAGSGDEHGGALDWNAGTDGNGNLTIDNCVIDSNTTNDGFGGGVALFDASGGSGTGFAFIENSVITNNVTTTSAANGAGGGVYVDSGATMMMANSQVSNNLASDSGGAGGGVFLAAPTNLNTLSAIQSCTIGSNFTGGEGGGVWNSQGVQINLATVIIGNTASGNGGGIYTDASNGDTTSLSHMTLTGNSAGGNGGGVALGTNTNQNFNMNFSRIVGNTAAAGTGFYTAGSSPLSPDLTNDWWGCEAGPSTTPCDTVSDVNSITTFDPWIVLNLTASPSTITLGGNPNSTTLTASFLQDNHGAAFTAANVSVLFGLPITFSNALNGTISNAQPTIQTNGNATATFTATASGTGSASAIVDSGVSTANFTINAGPADMTISKTHNGSFNQGQAGAVYTITVHNIGGSATVGAVNVTDTLPASMTATAMTGTGWNCTVATVSCTRSDALAAGSSYPAITLTVTVAPNAPSSVTNTATVSGGGEVITNNDTANDFTVINQIPDLTITKTHSGNFAVGQVGATYTLTVRNVGGGTTNGSTVQVVDTLPSPLVATAMTGTGWTCILGTLTCTRTDVLNAGTSYPVITLTVTVPPTAVPTTVTNMATVSGGGETNTANDTASDSTIIAISDLTITKTHTGNFFAGQTGATYTITVTNGGAGQTTAPVTVVDTLPTQLVATAISGTGWTCTLGTLTCTRSDVLANGASYPVITLTVNVAGTATPPTVTNTATVSGGGESNTANDTASDLTTITVSDLTIAKTHVGNFVAGQTGATYTLTVNNVGASQTSAPVTVVDNLPAPLVATAINGTGWACTLGTRTCTRADALANGASYPAITLTVSVPAGTAPTTVTNTATVSGGGESNTANDTASNPTVIVTPDLTITKTHAGNFAIGQIGATYTLTVNNAGGGPTSGLVTVVDSLPSPLLATAISGTGWTCVLATLTCTRADALAAGSSYPAITLTVNVPGTATVSTVTNTATVSGGAESNTANDTANDVTQILPPLSITPTATNNASVVAGGTAIYVFTVNTAGGPVGPINFACGSLPPGTACTFNNQGENQPSAQVTLSVSTTASTASASPLIKGTTPLYAALLLPFFGLVQLGRGRKKSKKSWLRLTMWLGGLVLLLAIAGCGGGNGVGNGNGGTPRGSFTFTVTATASNNPSTTATTTVNLTVQ